MGLGKCTGWPFDDLDPRSRLWHRLAKICLWVIHSWPWYWLVWPRWGGQMYRIVTGVTSDVGVPSTYLFFFEVIHQISRSQWLENRWFGANLSKITRPVAAIKSLRFALFFSCDQAALQMVFSVRLSVCPSVRPSVRLSHLFHHVSIIVSSWNFQELLPWSKVMSIEKVKVRGQRSRSQRSTPNLAVSGL